MNINTLQNHIESTIIPLKAIANDKRLAIICALRDGEKNVGELAKTINLSQSALSQHLARLRHDNILKTRRDAQTIFYSIADDCMFMILDCLDGIVQKKAGA